MTIYELMQRGEVLLVADSMHEHIVSWNTRNIVHLWMETEGSCQLLESRIFPSELSNVQAAIAAGTRLILNISDDARILLRRPNTRPARD